MTSTPLASLNRSQQRSPNANKFGRISDCLIIMGRVVLTVSWLKNRPELLLISWSLTRDGTGKPIINSSGRRPGRERGRLIIISAAERREGKQFLIRRGGARDGIGKFNY